MKRISLTIVSLLLCVAAAWALPRAEYPRPQFERADWVNLNGTWTCSFDFSGSGMEREFYKSKGFDKQITVPFCPESKLSGIGYTDFIEHFWYQRSISIPQEWTISAVRHSADTMIIADIAFFISVSQVISISCTMCVQRFRALQLQPFGFRGICRGPV